MSSASVVINNFNYGEFLPQAIDSALAQTHKPTEVVVVDDGSTDNSRTVIMRYGSRVRSVLKDNGGQASAINAGFAACEGKIVCFLDADDVLAPTAMEYAVGALAAPGIAKVHWPLRIVDESGRDLARVRPQGPLATGDLRVLLAREGPDTYCTSPMSGNAWSRQALAAVLPLPERGLRRFADGYLSALVPLYGSVAAINEPQGGYRVHRASHSATPFDRLLAEGVSYAHAVSRELAARCIRLGLEPQSSRWARHSFYPRLLAAVERLDGLVEQGRPFVLVDDGVWGLHGTSERCALPLIERDGVDWGPPSDDAAAIEALERRRIEGATMLIFGWPSFWWRDAYVSFERYLESRYPRLASDEFLIAFDLRESE